MMHAEQPMRSKQLSPAHRCHRNNHSQNHNHVKRYTRLGREEPFPDWLEEKIELPIFDDLPPPSISCLDVGSVKAFPSHEFKTHALVVSGPGIEVGCRVPPQPSLVGPPAYHQVATPLAVDQTSALIHELGYGMGGGGRTAHDTLTPPESPRDGDLVLTLLQEMQPHELDELVRMRADSLVEAAPEGLEGPPSAFEESDSAASPCSSVDPDWTVPAAGRRRRAVKPYARAPPEERRQRKKEQNKNAATRYRLKKKQEVEEIQGEEKELLRTNENLKQELTELTRETKYLKNLMRELFKAKGLIK